MADGKGTHGDRFDFKKVSGNRGADDIRDGIEGPDFVKMDFFRRGPVNVGFHFRQSLKHAEALLANPGR